MLVSHDTDQIARVCSKVLVLDLGRQRYLGEVAEGIGSTRSSHGSPARGGA